MLSAARRRHPWLDLLTADPEGQIKALALGHADIQPLGPAEPADAAASLLFGLTQGDPAMRALDDGCLAALASFRRDLVASNRAGRMALALDRLLSVVQRLGPPDTVRDLHRRYPYWFNAFELAVVDRNLDLRREYWRTLALTQTEEQGRRLMALWLEICGEAGRFGRYDESYFDVGELGIRKLPLGEDDGSNEEAVCHGLARWAVRQRPGRDDFIARWRQIESLYPRSPDFWPPVVEDVIAAVEDDLRKSFPAATWWLDDVEAAGIKPHQRQAAASWRAVEPPPRETREGILRDIGRPVAALAPRIDSLIAGHRRYAESTGDVFYLVRTACNIGMRLVKNGAAAEREERGRLAIGLARLALAHAPANEYAWALWRDGLAAQGRLEAAEAVGWETIRRFPENVQWRNQLAQLLGGDLGRPAEAEALLRETMALFPSNPVCRNQLAVVLSAWRDNQAGALAVVDQVLAAIPEDETAKHYRAIVAAGRKLRLAGAKAAKAPVRAEVDLQTPFPAALLRRGLFLVETAADGAARDAALDEVRRLLAEDPALAYGRYVAERVGLSSAGGAGTAFAVAFDRAVAARDAETLERLAARASGIDALTARAALAVVGGPSFATPEAAEDTEAGASVRRLAQLVSASAGAPPERRARLLSDYAGSALSLVA